MLDIRPAGPEDMGAIKILLAVCLLPSQDLGEERFVFFVAESERGIIGVCGIERCSERVALLRSVGVMPGYRKQQIGRRLIQRAVAHAEKQGIDNLYVLTESANDYFQNSGFKSIERKKAPAELKTSKLFTRYCPTSAVLMERTLRAEQSNHPGMVDAQISSQAKDHFDAGYHCAESVLLAAADHAGIRSPLIPSIATGFCHGTAHSWGTCGALNGAIMAINLTYGRDKPDEDTRENYQAVRKLIEEFGQACGSTLCSELMGCDLDTHDGRKIYQDNRLRSQCRELVGIAASLAGQLIDARQSRDPGNNNSSAAA